MAIYNLQNYQDLENDINFIFSRLNQIYEIELTIDRIKILPKIYDNSNTFWASDDNTIEFNKHIPNFKSIHKDMYSIIESIERHNEGKFEYSILESKYDNFKEFRLLNNMIKHPKKKEVEITFTKIVILGPNQFDLLCNFHYPDEFKCLNYSSLVILFLTILKDFKILK